MRPKETNRLIARYASVVKFPSQWFSVHQFSLNATAKIYDEVFQRAKAVEMVV